MVKKQFDAPYLGIEEKNGYTLLYDKAGNFSTIIKIENPLEQYNADKEKYYNFHFIFTSVIKILGAGFAIQKQDILCRKYFKNSKENNSFLTKKYFSHFENREYLQLNTYLIITAEINKSKFFSYDSGKVKSFFLNISKVIDFLKNRSISAIPLKLNETKKYIYQYFGFSFNSNNFNITNFEAGKNKLFIGDKNVHCISLVDTEIVEMPTTIKPVKEINLTGNLFPVDLFNFLFFVPDVEITVFNQVIQIPNQRQTIIKLEAKRKKHSSMPDPENNMSVEDINNVLVEVAKEGQMFVNTHFDIIISSPKDLEKSYNYIESSLFDTGILVSKQAYNQFELFRASLPGNCFELKDYDRFLMTSDAAICLMFKERIPLNENSNFQMFFTDRQGIPIAVDPSDLPMATGRCNNRNKFILGPSGSGKSFYTNHMVRWYFEEGSDVVIVDTGHSYSGLCEYYGGKYITYSEESPITMNPFRINDLEYNEEKREFLKSLVALLWKGTDGRLDQVEDTLLGMVIASYYNNYFFFKDGKKSTSQIKSMVSERWKKGEYCSEFVYFVEKAMPEDEYAQLKYNHNYLDDNIDKWFNILIKEKKNLCDKFLDAKHNEYIERQNQEYSNYVVSSLSFNSFYDYVCVEIPKIMENNKIHFDLNNFKFILKKFYKGGDYQKILNDDFDSTLFDEKFIVFEIDAIKEHKTLFPIVTLIIMDVFLQKMRIKKTRKILIIEEAWKAIASPLMANYILYLYKTVRKFFGEAIVVTQELDDIIKNEVVKSSIIANSDCVILLDQSKFKDKYQEIAEVLSLSSVEQKKIFTVNQLDNHSNRAPFKEVYIRRGAAGDVYGVEVSQYEYLVYTTERREKDAINIFKNNFKTYEKALDTFIFELNNSGVNMVEFTSLINSNLFTKYRNKFSGFETALHSIIDDYKNSGAGLNEFISINRVL